MLGPESAECRDCDRTSVRLSESRDWVWRPTATHLQSRGRPWEVVNSGFIFKVKAT